jgi:hypothetical protein
MDRMFIAIVAIFIVFFLITYIINHFFENKRLVKYIPALICLIFAIINMVLVRTDRGEGFRDLARALVAILLFSGFLSGFLSALYFDFISPRFRKRK